MILGMKRSSAHILHFFQAYTTTIPVVDGSQFKFIVDGELIVSSDHSTQYDTELKTENNVVKIYHYIFENENKGSFKKKSLLNSLSLSNPAIWKSILGKTIVANYTKSLLKFR